MSGLNFLANILNYKAKEYILALVIFVKSRYTFPWCLQQTDPQI